MKNLYELFWDSSKELKNTKNLVIAALLMTVGFILHFFTIPITQFARLSLGFLVEASIGMLFGPIVGAMCGGLSDIINYLATPTGPYFPGFTISGILGGIIYGTVLYNKKITMIRCAIVAIIVTILIDIFLNTFWLFLLYGKSFYALLPLRAVKDLAVLIIKVPMMYYLLNLVNKIKNI